MPKVSILIPTYNCGKYIGETIESTLNQTFEDYEIIISDNASTDNTEDIIKSLKTSKIKYCRNRENIGYTRNVHKLIHELATGQYCVILCADDYWEGEILKKGLDLFKKYGNLSFVFNNTVVKEQHSGRFIHYDEQFSETINGKEFFKLHLTKKIDCLIPSGIIFKKELALQLNGFGNFSLTCAPDWELRLKLSLVGNVGFERDSVTVYRWHTENLANSNSIYPDKFLDDIRCINYVTDFAESIGLDYSSLKKVAIRQRCVNYLAALPSLKRRGLSNSRLLSLFEAIYQTDWYALVNLCTIKASLVVFPRCLLNLCRHIKSCINYLNPAYKQKRI